MTSLPSVLVVDDEVENLDLLRRSLSERYDVETAESAEEALELLQDRFFTVIVSDHRMPGMTGVDLLNRVCQMAPETVRILLTGYADVETATSAINQGRVTGLLRKPVDVRVLQDEVDRCLSHYRLLAQNRALTRDLAHKNTQLLEAKRLLEMDLDARSRDLLEANQRLEQLVVRDGLTGLFNHRYFQERAEQEVASALRYGEPLSLLFCDVDYFKAYNDAHGHPEGDKLLVELSRLLIGHLRVEDIVAVVRESDIVARYGGEEFVVLLPRTAREGAGVVAERIRKEIEEHAFTAGETQPGGRVTVSMGLAECPRDATTKGDLVGRADTALFQAKSAGRNCVRLYDPSVPHGTAPDARPPSTRAASDPSADELQIKNTRLQRAVQRERGLRQEVEALLEEKTRSLYLANQELVTQQAARIQAEKLSALGRLSAGLAHEINNALNFIRGNLHHLGLYIQVYADLLAAYREACDSDAERMVLLQKLEQQKRLSFVQKDLPKVLSAMSTGTDRAAAIVRDMDVFARPEDAITVDEVDLKDPMELALVMAANRVKYKATVQKEYGQIPRVRCHQGKISQVFLNLLLNAADSIETAGEICITFKEDRDRVVVTVRDTGAGISEAEQGRLFEPFFTTKEPGKGTGLGLHMCRAIIKEHGGDIWFESKPGHGTLFFVSLPIAGPPGRAEPA